MFKFLVFVFLIQLVHWTTVSGELAAPTGVDNDVKTAVETKFTTPATSVSVAADGSACTDAAGANGEINKVRTALESTLGATDNTPTVLTTYGNGFIFYLAKYLVAKDAKVDVTKLADNCANLKKVVDGYPGKVASTSICGADTTGKPLAEGLINEDKSTMIILDRFTRYCTDVTASVASAHAKKFFDADYNYVVCSGTTPGKALVAAIDAAITKLRLLTAPTADQRKALFAAGAAPTNETKAPYSAYCTAVDNLYKEAFKVYYNATFDATACPAATIPLFFERIAAELVPGTKLACPDLLDPALAGTIPTTPAPPTPAPTVAGGGAGGNGSSFVKASFSFILFAVAIQKVWV
jgi:hypothetical protein